MSVATIDLASLGFVEETSTKEDWDHYEDTAKSAYQGPAPEGVYTFQLPKLDLQLQSQGGMIVDPQPGKENYLSIKVDISIAAGPHAGQTAKYQFISVKKFPNARASSAGNLLRAIGIKMQPTSNAEWLQAFAQASGKTFQGTNRWEGYDKRTGERLRGASNFPLGEDGKRQPFIQKGEGDTQYRVFANNAINWFETPPAAKKG